MHFQNKQILANAIYLLRNTISELPSVNPSHEFNTKEEEAKYDLWIHKLLAPWSKEGNDNASLKDELSLYLASPLASLKDDSLKKWESIKILYSSLYKIAQKYLSIVAVPAEKLFSKMQMQWPKPIDQRKIKQIVILEF